MPRLKDLLTYVTKPGLEDIWLLLDIKFDVDAEDVMRMIASTLAEVKPSRPWNQRVVLGCWAVSTFNIPPPRTISLIPEGKLSSTLRGVFAWLSDNTYWHQHLLCTPVPAGSWGLVQHVSKDYDWPLW